jgi:hypothetical protein
MEVSLIILGAMIVVGTILYIHDRISRRNEKPDEPPYVEPQQECCGLHMTCERDSLLTAVSDEIEYYDDEELDAFVGRDAESYSDSEIEQFRDVLLTLQPDDIAGWARSIQLRNIQLPSTVKDELLMIVAEARNAAAAQTAQ